MDDDTFFPKLSQNLLEILTNDNEYYDTIIEVGNDPYVKIFHAHTVILFYRSPYLRRILSTNKKKNDEILTHIKLPNISPEIFQIILRYIYGGRISLKEYDTLDIINILVATNELSLQELITHLQSYLIKNEKHWMEHNFNLIYQISFENDSFSKLQNFLLKWGIAQNPELPSDPSNYSKDDFNTLKNTLKKFIPIIKFYNLTSEEFLSKVFPYKKILPKELRNDLLKYFLDPGNQKKSKNIDLKIITNQHAELILKWIDKLEITDELDYPYEFELIFHGSRDGFSSRKFHEICDNKFHTITIIKVKDSNEILGGYNPVIWKSDESFGFTKDSFIFSFKDKNGIDNYILSRVIEGEYAIYNSIDFGPYFGFKDLYLCGEDFYDKSSCDSSDYEKPIRETNDKFSVEEYEIFQIMKNYIT
ncbi:hypothetical protein RclHR1_21300002 [Rhizophagus clarus]|uniref:BTB domain-containing protein n=1 Tax=Rhizophagus clarus TaxID=94130 RepID=A0A2Z6R5U0_9GLOM|nr:hypothetical protein RclHR1_21300002 [Rhizophagus clarus]